MHPQKLTPSPVRLPEAWEALRGAGFEIRDEGSGRVRVVRQGCGAVLEEAAGGVRFAVRPGLLFGDSIAHLVDCGFQKFWQNGPQRIPARSSELQTLHQMQRDLRAALGLSTLYNEALGTVSSKYIYDRVEGREAGSRHPSFD
jgi:hypothetical protein